MTHADETLAAYEGIAPRYDELNARTDTVDLVERYVELVDRYGQGGRRLLDAGCGTGRSSVAFRERGFEVTGYDLSPAMAAARDQLTEGGVLVFDMNTVGYYRRVFGAPTVVDRGDRYVAWFAESPPIEADAVVVTRFDLFERSGTTWRRVSMRHVQRHHSDRTVRRAAERAGLRVVATRGLVETSAREPADEESHDRILYAARRLG
ncbi:methyltransferase domain-containing protein [Streptosporangium sp. NPDC049376]|uniref:methyltransferase domain-containing protein n=1 Tax=Streptosporangium sp. NPDC049376 TaxID=3366192 RepID=UPI0037AF7147